IMAFRDEASEQSERMGARPGHRSVQVHGRGIPPPREDERSLAAGAALAIDRRQQRAQLGGHAEAALVLQAAFPEHGLQRDGRILDAQARLGNRRSEVDEMPSLEHELPSIGEAPVEDHARRDQPAIGSLLDEAERTELDLHLPFLGHGGVRGVERPVRARGERRREDSSERQRRARTAHSSGVAESASKCVTESAFVQTPTLPASLKVSSCASMTGLPSKWTWNRFPRASTASVCQVCPPASLSQPASCRLRAFTTW